jgi:hypothetical protein
MHFANHISPGCDISKAAKSNPAFMAVQQPHHRLNQYATLMSYFVKAGFWGRILLRSFGCNRRAG